MRTAADDALCCQGPVEILIHETWWKVVLLAGSRICGCEPHNFFCRSERGLDLSAEMLVSFLRRRLGSVLLVLHRDCVVFCATETAALTVMLLSLPLRCQQNCVDLTGTFSLVLCRQKAEALIASLKWLPSRAADPFIGVSVARSCLTG